MSLKETIQSKMYEAMKAQRKAEKDAYALLLGRLQKEEVDKRRALTPEEETGVVSQLVKQCKEGYSEVEKHEAKDPAAKEAFLAKTAKEIEIFSQFMPQQMTDDEVMAVIKETMEELGIMPLNNSNKGLLMKHLMPKVKGKADGKQVANLVNLLLIMR